MSLREKFLSVVRGSDGLGPKPSRRTRYTATRLLSLVQDFPDAQSVNVVRIGGGAVTLVRDFLDEQGELVQKSILVDGKNVSIFVRSGLGNATARHEDKYDAVYAFMQNTTEVFPLK